jgi:L-malate glycosyltransferase
LNVKTRVLYVNHTSEMSGAERSLLTLLGGLPPTISPVVACPAGALADAARAMSIHTVEIPGIKASFRLDPRHTPRAVLDIANQATAVRRVSRQERIDLVHANSVRAGLAAGLARRFGGPPTVVHVRDCLPASATGKLTRAAIMRSAALVIANSEYTARNFARRSTNGHVRVVHNAVDPNRFGAVAHSREEARAELGLTDASQVLGVVAQITPWKGQDDAIRILADLSKSWPDLHLLLIGEAKFRNGAARYDSRKFMASLERLAHSLGVTRRVRFLGERPDLWTVLPALDLLLVPSWEEPFGVSLIEAMSLGIPVVATQVGGPAEIVRNGQDGVLLPPRQPHLWAEAIDRLLRKPDVRRGMGASGKQRTTATFSRDNYVKGVMRCYEWVRSTNGANPDRADVVLTQAGKESDSA